jgi:hypothetical protein
LIEPYGIDGAGVDVSHVCLPHYIEGRQPNISAGNERSVTSQVFLIGMFTAINESGMY